MEQQTKKDRDKDNRLRKKYLWTLDMYNRLSEKQGGKCGVCGRSPKADGMPLNLDHEHFKIVVEHKGWVNNVGAKSVRWWVARVDFSDGRKFEAGAITQKAARDLVRRKALPYSVRGLLCPGRYMGCNRLMGRIDKIEWLEKVLNYLKNPPAKGMV